MENKEKNSVSELMETTMTKIREWWIPIPSSVSRSPRRTA